jgi:hypothetical protein
MAAEPGGSQKAEVSRLADIAMRAADHERECRASLAARGRRVARKTIVIGGAASAGFVLISMFRHHRRDDEDGRKHRDLRGTFERAGDAFLTLVRWGMTASQLVTMAFSPQPGAAETLPDA